MPTLTYTKSGAKATSQTQLDKKVFNEVVTNHELLKQAYTNYLANSRQNLAVTKTRGEVRGGGKKPWKQKGTGRARFGSSRVPIWRGGGITFGPTGEENYTKKMNVKAKRKAIRQALTLKKDCIKIIEKFDFNDAKVSTTAKLLNKIDSKGNVLIVLGNNDDLAKRATNNLKNVQTVSSKYLNVYDLLNADTIAIEKDSLGVISEWLGGSK